MDELNYARLTEGHEEMAIEANSAERTCRNYIHRSSHITNHSFQVSDSKYFNSIGAPISWKLSPRGPFLEFVFPCIGTCPSYVYDGFPYVKVFCLMCCAFGCELFLLKFN